MRRANATATGVIVGALVGAGLTLLLMPESRRALRRRMSGWWSRNDADLLDFDHIAQEAGASEGAWAATRTWQSGAPQSP
jgi:hypothetical protein